MGKLVWLSLMMIVSLLICCEQCSIAICFSWKVSLSSLTLICKVNSLNHRIIIDNQFGREVADCIRNYCHPYHQNASIIQLLTTNETIYSVYGQIDNKINGNWTCRHGTNLDIAKVEVTVLKDEQKLDDQVINYKEECRKKPTRCKNVHQSCTESLIMYTLVGFVAMIAVCAASNVMKEICCKDKLCCCRNTCKKILIHDGGLQKRALVGIFLILLFLFGIPVLVSFIEKETCSVAAIPAMVIMGMTLGSATGILFFRRKKEISPTRNEQVDQSEPLLNVICPTINEQDDQIDPSLTETSLTINEQDDQIDPSWVRAMKSRHIENTINSPEGTN